MYFHDSSNHSPAPTPTLAPTTKCRPLCWVIKDKLWGWCMRKPGLTRTRYSSRLKNLFGIRWWTQTGKWMTDSTHLIWVIFRPKSTDQSLVMGSRHENSPPDIHLMSLDDGQRWGNEEANLVDLSLMRGWLGQMTDLQWTVWAGGPVWARRFL